MWRSIIIDFKGNSDYHIPLFEFAYDKNYHLSIQMAAYDAFYWRRCKSLVGWFKVGKPALIGPYIVHQAMEKVKVIEERSETT